ncbi:phenylacetate-CoA oxygenase subunit PaaI [Hellea sp.]|nr:phenylacetate-CoA oxygenase subunit PaaI [Hellea sp.]MDC1062244.1 phenylacetate-CoA oxygenase subunit PaaI [Hellea sp.]
MKTDNISQALLGELLCISDSKWVLGHWYVKVIPNGRSVPDFSSMAGMAQDELGQTRAMLDYLEQSFNLPENQLEFGRSIEDIHSMELLDASPRNWGDFVVTAFLAEQALWSVLEGFVGSSNVGLSNMCKKFSEEGYFHRLYVDGWMEALTDEEKQDAIKAMPKRLSHARQWFNFGSDLLNEKDIRPWSASECREHFELGLGNLAKALSLGLPKANEFSGSWDGRRRRPEGSAMPAGLWEYVLPTTEAAQMARRPLAESVKDNIDLFVKSKKVDKTEPFFEQ